MVITDQEFEYYKKAGQIAAQALEFGSGLIKPGVRLLEVADKVEQKIIDLGGMIAFPVNISLNETAAHYTPIPEDKLIFNDEIVKLDVGAHVNGYIGDTATTIDLSNKYSDLVKASLNALNTAIKTVRPGATLREIGKEVEDAVKSVDPEFNPVRNLSGHEVSQYRLHTGLSIPNYAANDSTELKKGQVIAIEPFATTGNGLIHEKGDPSIYSMIQKKPIRSPAARLILNKISGFNNLPFATRWLKDIPKFKIAVGLRELERQQILKSYPPLVEKSNGIVSQAEHTVIVKDKPIVITKL